MKQTVIDMTNYKFNGCEALKRNGSDKNGKAMWEVKCHCGRLFTTSGNSIRSNQVSSCGCSRFIKTKNMGEENKTHGDTLKPLYITWKNMKSRCYNKNHKSFKYYGGRGITVCDEWKTDYVEFKKWAIRNGYNEKLTIDRIDNNGNYSPKNCRWVNLKTQGRNKRNNTKDFYKGKMRTLSEIAEILGESKSFVRYRYKNQIDYDKPKRFAKDSDLT